MERELTKEELEAQIEQKERRLETDFDAASDELLERTGFHMKVTVPLSLVALTTLGVVARRLAVRRTRLEFAEQPKVGIPVLALFTVLRRIRPRSLMYGAALFGAGALMGSRRARTRYVITTAPAPTSATA